MKKIIVSIVLVCANISFAGDFVRQQEPILQQRIIGIFAFQAAIGGHQIQRGEKKEHFKKEMQKQKNRNKKQTGVIPTKQKYPKKRQNTIHQPR